jgi:hypothetical protein
MLQKDLVARSLDGAIVGRPLLPDSMAANLLVVLNSVRYAVHVVTCDEREPAEVEARLTAYDSGSPVNDAAQGFFSLWPGFTFTRDILKNGKPPARASAHATVSALTTYNPMQGGVLPKGAASSAVSSPSEMGNVTRYIDLCEEPGKISDGEKVRFHLDETAPSVSFVSGLFHRPFYC